jgi:hypothetical protein
MWLFKFKFSEIFTKLAVQFLVAPATFQLLNSNERPGAAILGNAGSNFTQELHSQGKPFPAFLETQMPALSLLELWLPFVTNTVPMVFIFSMVLSFVFTYVSQAIYFDQEFYFQIPDEYLHLTLSRPANMRRSAISYKH